MTQIKRKVLAYITRCIDSQMQLLVFKQKGRPESRTQVPGGTVDQNEDICEALVREIHEESGLRMGDFYRVSFTGRHLYHYTRKDQRHQRFFFHCRSRRHLPERWQHRVGGDGKDEGLIFCYRWENIDEVSLAKDQGHFLHIITD